MDARESEHLFSEADRLYREKRYSEALSVLEKLDDAFPDEKNIMMPRALCLAHLGQVQAARLIYDRLAARYPVERIAKLHKLLQKLDAQVQTGDSPQALHDDAPPSPEDLVNARITMSPQAVQDARRAREAGIVPPQAITGPSWAAWAAIGATVAVLLVLLSMPLFLRSDGASSPREQPDMTVITEETIEELPPAELRRFLIVLTAVLVPLSLLTLPIPIFLTLVIFGALPRETFLANYGLLFGKVFLIYLITGILFALFGIFFPTTAFLGWMLAVVFTVRKEFELTIPATLCFVAFTAGLVFIETPAVMLIMRLFNFDVTLW